MNGVFRWYKTRFARFFPRDWRSDKVVRDRLWGLDFMSKQKYPWNSSSIYKPIYHTVVVGASYPSGDTLEVPSSRPAKAVEWIAWRLLRAPAWRWDEFFFFLVFEGKTIQRYGWIMMNPSDGIRIWGGRYWNSHYQPLPRDSLIFWKDVRRYLRWGSHFDLSRFGTGWIQEVGRQQQRQQW